MSRQWRLIAAAVGLLGVSSMLGAVAWSGREALPPIDRPSMDFPSLKGLNYGVPRTRDGTWVGVQWLRSGTGLGDYWPDVRPVVEADLDFIQRNNLGRVIRLFVGLDQAMIWDGHTGFVRFHEATLANFDEALKMFEARGMKVVAVLYDQEETGSLGNFHFEALDGRHDAMRAGYLRATEIFLRRFGSRPGVAGWDLFNEAYNSLGRDGPLPKPPAANPVSPNYSGAVVHGWLRDLYQTAKRAAPGARFTVSDATELYWKGAPDLSKYEGVLDFYDIHVYDDHPQYPDWTGLRKPIIVGEAGASVTDSHLRQQRYNAPAARYLLEQAQRAGVQAVLLHAIADDNIFTQARDALTATGTVLSDFNPTEPSGPSPARAPRSRSWSWERLVGQIQRVGARLWHSGLSQ